MSSMVSVSKGCFAFPKKRKTKDSLGQYPKEMWYRAYKKAWSSFEVQLQEIESKSLEEVFKGVLDYVALSPTHQRQEDELPAATLLTGVNMTDHSALFATLTSELKKKVTPHVAVLWAQDCTNLKTTVERLCSQFMTVGQNSEDIDNDEDIEMVNSSMSKVHCTFPVLVRWYKQLSKNQDIHYMSMKLQSSGAGKPLVVIIPNFECCSHKVLQDFIPILSANRRVIPLTLIFGVATSVSAVHRSLPHHVSSKLCIQLFHTPPSSNYFNEIFDTVILSPEHPFHLGSKTFKTLLDVFLYYNFSVSGFIQELKFCMTEHFYGKKWAALCCSKDELSEMVHHLSREDLESVRSLPSLRQHIESLPTLEARKKWIKDDIFFRTQVLQLLSDLHDSCATFSRALRSLYVFVLGLPKNLLGKHLRDLYADAISTNITSLSDYHQCIKILHFTSRDELIEKLEKLLLLFPSKGSLDSQQRKFADDIEEFILELKRLEVISTEVKSPTKAGLRTPTKSPLKSPTKVGIRSPLKNRSQFKKTMVEMAAQHKAQRSPYEELREVVFSRLQMFWERALVPPTSRVLHEVLFFDNLSDVRPNVIGTPRLAVQTALNDPHAYLNCDCCKLTSTDDIPPSLPDLCIVYKIHRESGRHINMYDWLQAYLMIVCPDHLSEDEREVDPKLQARFTRAVAELQFLGYIKSSSRKTDHVTRLTWA